MAPNGVKFQLCQAGGYVATCSGLPQTAFPSESNSHPPTFADIHLHPYVHLHPHDPMIIYVEFKSGCIKLDHHFWWLDPQKHQLGTITYSL